MDRRDVGSARILRGNALALPLAAESVDLVVTSPPYFGLRSYQDGGEHYAGQIGSEATPAEFVDALIAATREMVRVVKPSGSIWVNLGDKYSSNSTPGPQSQNSTMTGGRHKGVDHVLPRRLTPGAPNKSLIGIPWRYALRCIDDLGLILRAEVIWSKPNGLPESVTDRVRRSHEQWFHFTRSPRYYSAVDEIREAHARPDIEGKVQRGHSRRVGHGNNGFGLTEDFVREYNPLGKLPGSVWTIPTQPLTVPPELGIDHFAAFPMEWPRRIIQGWSPAGVCTACGEGRRPVKGIDWSKVPHQIVDKRAYTEPERARFAHLFRQWQDERGLTGREIAELFPSRTGGLTGCVANWRTGHVMTAEQVVTIESRFGALPPELVDLVRLTRSVPVSLLSQGTEIAGRNETTGGGLRSADYQTITGYACACPDTTAPTTPATILDPFGGTGTTALVAKALGRTGISVDMSADYCRLAQWRTTDPGELARAMQVEKPQPQVDGQLSIFDVGGVA